MERHEGTWCWWAVAWTSEGDAADRSAGARGAREVRGEETMPQLVALILVGAGLYAGFRWLTLELRRHAEEAARVSEEVRSRAAAAARTPKDLGALEWDERAGVYRPRASA